MRGKREYLRAAPAPRRRRRGAGRLPEARPSRVRRSARVPHRGATVRGAQAGGVRDRWPDRLAGERAGWPGPGWRASLAAHGRDRGAARRRAVGGDRVAASPSRLRHDDGVREGRLGPAQRARPPMAGSAGMTGLDEAVSDYLTIRRALGFKLVEHQRLLPISRRFWSRPARTRSRPRSRSNGRAPPAGRRAGKRHGCRSCAGSRSTCGRSTRRRRSLPKACCAGSHGARSRTCIPITRSHDCSRPPAR